VHIYFTPEETGIGYILKTASGKFSSTISIKQAFNKFMAKMLLVET